jgi:ATP-dependent protease HslVU (ClpYQ) peptidase subunit
MAGEKSTEGFEDEKTELINQLETALTELNFDPELVIKLRDLIKHPQDAPRQLNAHLNVIDKTAKTIITSQIGQDRTEFDTPISAYRNAWNPIALIAVFLFKEEVRDLCNLITRKIAEINHGDLTLDSDRTGTSNAEALVERLHKKVLPYIDLLARKLSEIAGDRS